MNNRTHTMMALILAIVGLYMVRLHSVEIQPWDEGLYAARGESIDRFNDWIDQTPHAIGGLYSGTAPPVVPWGIAIGIHIFGKGVVGVRIFTVLCSGLALLMLMLIARRLVSFNGAILSVCLLGSSITWTIYSRQGLTEVPLMAFILVSLYGLLERRWWLIGIGLGAALLTKMTVSVLPILLAVPFVIRKEFRFSTLLGITVGVALAAPWYAYMSAVHGQEFYMAFFSPHLFNVVEAGNKSLGFLYYINQLILGQPLIVFGFLYVLALPFRRHALPGREDTLAWTTLLWFLGILFIFSIARTKNPHYTVMLVPPAILLTVYGLERLLHTGSRRTIVIAYLFSVVAVVYSLAPSARSAIKLDPLGMWTIGILVVAVLATLFLLTFPNRAIDVLAVRGFRPIVYGITGIAFLHSIATVWEGYEGQIAGGSEAATVLLASGSNTFVYLYHKQNDGDRFNPQLSWYTAGWMNGWLDNKTYATAALPMDSVDISTLAEVAVGNQPYVVYYHSDKQRDDVNDVVASLAASYDVVLDARHYTVFALR
ncbi:MAG: glycosyltransferase family 39 protein [Ignavibacteria bacterium]|nr:glycosyltransferase family 39 protein [Ignavibacteria bacterium]